MTEEDYMPGFTQRAMYDQLGKIIDSADMQNPITQVTTDDGDVITGINATMASKIRAAVMRVPVQRRLEALHLIQRTESLRRIVARVS